MLHWCEGRTPDRNVCQLYPGLLPACRNSHFGLNWGSYLGLAFRDEELTCFCAVFMKVEVEFSEAATGWWRRAFRYVKTCFERPQKTMQQSLLFPFHQLKVPLLRECSSEVSLKTDDKTSSWPRSSTSSLSPWRKRAYSLALPAAGVMRIGGQKYPQPSFHAKWCKKHHLQLMAESHQTTIGCLQCECVKRCEQQSKLQYSSLTKHLKKIMLKEHNEFSQITAQLWPWSKHLSWAEITTWYIMTATQL